MSQFTRKELLAELVGTTCRCGARKVARQTFCRAHYFRLPAGMRNALYDGMGQGYEDAYGRAAEFLHLPGLEAAAKPSNQQ